MGLVKSGISSTGDPVVNIAAMSSNKSDKNNNNSDYFVNATVSPKPWSPSRGSPQNFDPNREFKTNGLNNYPGSNQMRNGANPTKTTLPSVPYFQPVIPPLMSNEGWTDAQRSPLLRGTLSLDLVLRSLHQTLIRMLAREYKKGERPFKPSPPKRKSCCTLCLQNEEDPAYYSSHTLRDPSGKVSCPVLRSYVCRLCGATGDHAHTLRYCPRWTGPTAPLALLLKKGSRDCSGRVKKTKGPPRGGN